MNIATPDERVEVIDFEQFAERHDAGRFVWDVATNRLPNTSEGQRKRIQAWEQKKSAINLTVRDVLREIYAELQADGWVREPTSDERVARTAAGHEDNPSVQAARRVQEKRAARAAAQVQEAG